MLRGHGGNIYETARRLGCAPSEVIDMSSNINPLGPPPGLLEFLKQNIGSITALPEVDGRGAAADFAAAFDIDPQRVLAGGGTTQFIYALPRILATRRALIVGPTYADYADACRQCGVKPGFVLAGATDNFQPDIRRIHEALDGVDTVFICNPNNPTGALIPSTVLAALCESHPHVRFVIDESYLPFAPGGGAESLVPRKLENVLVLASISKVFRIPGLRTGFIVSATRMTARIRSYLLPWSVNSLAQAAVGYLARHRADIDAFIAATRQYFERQRKEFYQMLENVPELVLFPGATPFVLAGLPPGLGAAGVCGRLARARILVRDCGNFYGLSDGFIRISLKTPEANRRLAAEFVPLIKTMPAAGRMAVRG